MERKKREEKMYNMMYKLFERLTKDEEKRSSRKRHQSSKDFKSS